MIGRSAILPFSKIPVFGKGLLSQSFDLFWKQKKIAETFLFEGKLSNVTNKYGLELIPNGSFSANSDWSEGAQFSIHDGRYYINTFIAGSNYALCYIPGVVGKSYKVEFDIFDLIGSATVGLLGNTLVPVVNGHNTITIKPTADWTYFIFLFAENSSMSIDNVSMKDIIRVLYNEVKGRESEYLTITGTLGSYHYTCPNTPDYVNADLDFAWFKTDGTVSDMTDSRLNTYDLQRTPVQFDDTAPNTNRKIGILLPSIVLTAGRLLNQIFQRYQLPLEWHNDTNANGHTKSNRSGQNLWTPELVFSNESKAYFARMVVQPPDALKWLIDEKIRAMITGGIWDELDKFVFMNLHTEQASMLDIKGYRDNLHINSPAWTEKVGVTIADGKYVSTQYNAVDDGVKYTANSASIMNHFASAAFAAVFGFSGRGSGGVFTHLSFLYGSSCAYNRFDSGGGNDYQAGDNGFVMCSRENNSGNIKELDNTGAEQAADVDYAGLFSADYLLGTYNGVGDWCTGFVWRQIAFGSGMTAVKRALLRTIVNDFNSRIGAIY